MAHLAVARRLLPDLTVNDPGAFYLGSVAPDAYHWLKEEKRLSDRFRAHLSDGGDARERIRARFGGARTDFEAGYALHLLVDLYWDGAVLQPFLRGHPYAVYTHDMGVLDITLYVREDAEKAVFPQLAAAEPRGLDDLIFPEQAKLERDLTLAWYRERTFLKDEPLNGPFSLTELTGALDGAARFSAREWMGLATQE